MVYFLIWIMGIFIFFGLFAKLDEKTGNIDISIPFAMAFFWPVVVPIVLLIGIGIKVGELISE
jgi:ABC-type uncharacterized transport system permease subunit